MPNKLFVIEEDLLGLVSFLVRGGNGQCQYGAGIWFLREVSELTDLYQPKGEAPEDTVGDHIVHLALDNISCAVRDVLLTYALGLCSLTPDTDRYLRDRGFLYGEEPKLPVRVRKYCYERFRFIYGN
jgi:hypothetical protein